MHSGDLIWIDFPGAIQTKRRPAVILSSDAYHRHRPDVVVGLITSQISRCTAPTDHVLADWQASGLSVPSAFRAYLITLPRSSVISRIGTLSKADAESVTTCVKLALGL